MNLHTTVLFDIDGTLLLTQQAGSRAIDLVFEEVFGQPRRRDLQLHGRTDRAILTQLLADHGIEPDEPQLARFLAAYLPRLENHLQQFPGTVLPGVRALLDWLSQQPSVAVGLLTGNVRAGAELKLQYHQLGGYFHFGGYGDRHVHRDDVAREASAAARAHLGPQFCPSRVIVIGDTVHDVTCARAIGAQVIAVLTGGCDAEQLDKAGPDFLCPDLSQGIDLLQSIIDQTPRH